MTPLFRRTWILLRSSFWFLPALIVLGAIVLAGGLILAEVAYDWKLAERWPLLFGGGVSGSRGLLTAVASSMITVAGVVFSITMVTLALTATQYSSRVLRSFMRDRFTQTVLGVFVGIFVYCLIVLRTIQEHEQDAFVPSIAVFGGLVLALVGVGYLVFFVHHVSVSIQASTIIGEIAHETCCVIDALYPEDGADHEADKDDVDVDAPLHGRTLIAIAAPKSGYVQTVDQNTMREVAREHDCVVRMERGVGEFVVAGEVLISAQGPPLEKAPAKKLQDSYVIGRHRTLEWDVGFGVRQIVDIALKALSPGINDTTTAVMCVDYLGAIMNRLANRPVPLPHAFDDGTLRVIGRGPTFHTLLAQAFDQIRQNVGGNVSVLTRQLEAIERIALVAKQSDRRFALQRHADLVAAEAQRSIACAEDAAGVADAHGRVTRILMQTATV